MQRRSWMLLGCGLALLSSAFGTACAQSHAASGAKSVRQSFELAVPYAPTPASVGHERHLIYELHLTSFAPAKLTVTRVEVQDAATGTTLYELRGDRLYAALHTLGETAGTAERARVGTGDRAVVYLQVPLQESQPPRQLRHRIEFDAVGSAGRERAAVAGGEVSVADLRLPPLGPPLRGGPWVAVYHPQLERGHRRMIYAVGGRARIPGRHAVDWMAAGPAKGDIRQSGQQSQAGYGADVLAVADAVVASTRDGVAEPPAGAPRPSVALGDATGNYVALDLGSSRYAFYEHLAPGLLVRPGDRVRRGQVIGRLGSTGQASRPHLHFHVANANSPLAAEGLPFTLTGGRVVGAYLSMEAWRRGDPWQREAMELESTFPLPMAVVSFPAADD